MIIKGTVIKFRGKITFVSTNKQKLHMQSKPDQKAKSAYVD